jgi:pimeloyl-ACP methyl ester carboxylesterase
VSYDNLGCGRSSTPLTLEYTTVQMAKDALVLIDHLCWPQCHVVGVSMGGMIALELALLAPRRILSLTPMVTHAGGLLGQAPLIGLRLMLRSFVIRDEDGLVNNTLAMLYGQKTLSDPEKRQVSQYS